MKGFSAGRWLLILAVAGVFVAGGSLAQARSNPDPEKYAHRIEKKLAHYKKGALLHIVFSNNAEAVGTVSNLGERSFILTNVETNATETHNYGDVYSIGKGSNAIGQGSGAHHHRGPF
jgi:hypothetical protein